MFYRRKILLSLLELGNGEIGKTKLHKLLFLYSQLKRVPEYDFVPYKFGCYSHSAKADLSAMVKRGYLSESDKSYTKIDASSYVKMIRPNDRQLLTETVSRYGCMTVGDLMRDTYIKFPYYAIKSTKAEEVLDKESYTRVMDAVPKDNAKVLFTIGYEGISLESYLNRLLRNNIKLLIDVRKNPLSMKYGFSRVLLAGFCAGLGIAYRHIPEVGINASQRQNLEKQEDYVALFEKYKKTTLKETLANQEEIIDLLNRHNRIALTCFESDIRRCHRLPLTESLKALGPDVDVEHI